METDNAVALQGILKELRKVDNINTLPFNGYELTVITERRSGALDETIVYAQSNNVDSIEVNAPVMVLGSLQAYKNFISTGRKYRRSTDREAAQMTEAEALQALTGTRDDYNDYARALNIAIRVLREHVAEIDKKSQNQRREREADYESNKHY